MIEESAAPTVPMSDMDNVSEIAELLTGEDPAPVQPEQEAEAAQPEGEDPQPGGDEEAERRQIDYDLEIPIGPELEAVTLGGLKDFYKENQDWKQEQSDWDDTRTEQENQQMVARQELVELVGLLGEVNPAALQKLDQIRGVNAEREKAMLLQVRPEWADPAVKATASTRLLALVKEYGFSDAEYNAIDNHKVLKLLDDYASLKAKTAEGKAALEKVPDAGKLNKPVQKKVSKAQKDRAAIDKARNGTDADRLKVITGLIGG